jgi:hypothetical protein
MSKSCEELSSYLYDIVLFNIINTIVSYPKTKDEINETNGIIECQFDITNFDSIILAINDNIDIKCHRLTSDIICLLKLINLCKSDLLLRQADNLLIKKNNFILLKLENSLKPNSGRSINIDINYFRAQLEFEVKTKYEQRMKFFGIIIVGSLIVSKIFKFI